MSTEIERIAEEIDACNLPYSMELVRLVDSVSTYELRINGEVREFGDLDDLYEHVRVAKANAKAEVITKFLATARAEARKAALEVAADRLDRMAGVCDGLAPHMSPSLAAETRAEAYAYRNGAAAIRALIERESEEG